MKNLKILSLFILCIVGLSACEDDDSLTYIAQPAGELTFSNSVSSEYILIPEAAGNLGERFTWDDADFGIPTNITYELQRSFTGNFDDVVVVGTTSDNEYALTIGDLMDIAREAGLDNDPETLDEPNAGTVYFRLRAFSGTDSSVETISNALGMNLVLPEDVGDSGPACSLDQLWIVGAAAVDAGWAWDTPIKIACSGDGIYSANINLTNETFRFFTSEGDWNSGQNYPYFTEEGYEIDSSFENAEDGDSNFRFLGDPGYYSITVNTNDKTITLGEPQATGVCEFEQLWLVGAGVPDAGWDWATPVKLLCTGEGVYSGSVTFENEAFRFFTENGDWASGRNYLYYNDAGFTIDANFANAEDGDSNFSFIGTPGTYTLTVDVTDKVISIN